MTPVSVKWMYVSDGGPGHSGSLCQAICARGDKGMVGLTLTPRPRIIQRTHWTYDAAPEVMDHDELHRVAPVPLAHALTTAEYLGGVSHAGAQFLAWLAAGRHRHQLLHVDDYVSEEPQAVVS
jgi:hypothetical protein